MALSEAEITKKILKDPRPRKVSDAGGLYLQIMPSGSAIFRLKYYFAGKEKLATLGHYGEVTLAEARAERDRFKLEVRAGRDPIAERKAADKKEAAEAAEAIANTFGRYADDTLAFEDKGGQAPQTEKKWRLHLGYAKDEFGARPIASITPPEVLAFLNRYTDRAETLHSIKRKMSDVFRRAMFEGACPGDPTMALKDFLKPARSKRHPAVIQPARFGAVLRAIDGHRGEPSVRGALLFLSLTFQRPHMVREMLWEHVNWQAKRWEIPAAMMKGQEGRARDHVVPLSEPALEVLRSMRAISGDGPLVFPSRKEGKTIAEKTLNKALRSRGVDDHVGHGFRASANTMIKEHLAEKLAARIPLGAISLQELIDIQLAHVIGDETRRAYDRVQFLELRTVLMETWAEFIDACRRRDPKVVKLRSAGESV